MPKVSTSNHGVKMLYVVTPKVVRIDPQKVARFDGSQFWADTIGKLGFGYWGFVYIH